MILVIESGPDGPTVWLDTITQTSHTPTSSVPWSADEAAIAAGAIFSDAHLLEQGVWRRNLGTSSTSFAATTAGATADQTVAAASIAESVDLRGLADKISHADLTDPATLQATVAALTVMAAAVAAALVDLNTRRAALNADVALMAGALTSLTNLAQAKE